MDQQERHRGRFQPGHKRLGGRKKGQGNKYSVDVRAALLAAGEQLGGDEGLTGFFKQVGTKDPRMLGAWIAALVPRTPLSAKTDAFGDPVEVPGVVINLVGIPSGTFLSKAEVEAQLRDQLPAPLEHEPLTIDNDAPAPDVNDIDDPKTGN